jgi:hypothetical protein
MRKMLHYYRTYINSAHSLVVQTSHVTLYHLVNIFHFNFA